MKKEALIVVEDDKDLLVSGSHLSPAGDDDAVSHGGNAKGMALSPNIGQALYIVGEDSQPVTI